MSLLYGRLSSDIYIPVESASRALPYHDACLIQPTLVGQSIA